MNIANNIRVFLHFSPQRELLVGELVKEKQDIYFKYSPAFLQSNYELSPYRLPLKQGVFKAPRRPFEGLFGVFDDSLPDGWGRLLLDRKLRKQGVNPQDIGPLDRLSFLGSSGSGALIYRPKKEEIIKTISSIQLDKIASESIQLLEGSSEDVVDSLYNLGGSSGGARPKIHIGFNPRTNHIIAPSSKLTKEYEHWIIKFPSPIDFPDIAEIEFAYYLMAKDTGLEMSACRLLEGKSGKKYFATKRFDRGDGKNLHLLSAAGMLHDDFQRSSVDYGHIMDAAFTLEKSVSAYEKLFRLAAFNVFNHNRDDHSKNFSFLMSEQGDWRFAPAYDLTFSSSSYGMHSTTIAGEGERPKEKHLLELAEIFDVNTAPQILEKVKDVSKHWREYANKAGVSKESTTLIHDKLRQIS